MQTKYNVGILGCGAIFDRHVSAITLNSEHFTLVGIHDPKSELQTKYVDQLKVKGYQSEQYLYNDSSVNCVVILSPNHLHFKQAYDALTHGKHVIMEKPATLKYDNLLILENYAKSKNLEIFTILQVRLNPSVTTIRKLLETGLLGGLRGASLIQRWQRPLGYFSEWRGSMETGGGILREFAIHYLDVMQYLVGIPEVAGSVGFNTKFSGTNVCDTVYALFDFGRCGGSMEVTISSEPKNLECSLSLMFDQGFIKLGGKSLDVIVEAQFSDDAITAKLDTIKSQVDALAQHYLQAQGGASPYHPELYRRIIQNPSEFGLEQTKKVVQLVENIYRKILNK